MEHSPRRPPLAFLAEASATLARSLDAGELMPTVARLAVDELADMAVVTVVDEDGHIRHPGFAHREPEQEALLHELYRQHAYDATKPHPVLRAMELGRPVVVAEVPELLLDLVRDADHHSLMARMRARSMVAVPMVARGRTLGALMVARNRERPPFTAHEVDVVQELGNRAALALDNARLFEAERAARLHAERLEALAAALSAATSVDEAAHAAVSQITAASGAQAGALCLLDASGAAEVVASVDMEAESLRALQQVAGPAGNIADILKTRAPACFESRAAQAALLVDPGFGASAMVPILVEDGAIGVVCLFFTEPRSFRDEARALMLAAGRQTGLAIRRAQLFDSEQRERARAQRVVDLTARLQNVTEALSAALTPEGIAAAIIDEGSAALGTDAAALYLLDREHEHLEMLRQTGFGATAARFASMPVSADAPVAYAVRTNEEVWLEDAASYAARFPTSAERARATGMVTEFATVCLPLGVGDHAYGGLTFVFHRARRFDDDERRFIRLLGRSCAQALDRARLFDALRAALDAARVAERRKDEFLAMLGHELRNPLAPILLALQLIQERGPDPFAREHEVVERQVRHLERLVDDLLDISRITRGKIELKRERVTAADIVAKAIELSSPLLEQKGHRLEVRVPEEGVFLYGDRVRLIQIVSNLVGNAAKYTPDAGDIRVSATLEGTQVALRVADSGIGIDPALLPRLFDIFVQAPQSLARAQGGLGLGLAIVRRLVEMHGGTVEAYSDGVGLGAELVVRLPAALEREGQAPSIPPRVEPPPITGRRVMVVDDNEDAAELTAMALTRRGYVVATAYDGLAALDLARRFAPEVVCLDLGLPLLDGYEVARRLRGESSGVKLIAVTGYGQAHDRGRSLAAGFDLHFVKPVDLEVLVRALEAPMTLP